MQLIGNKSGLSVIPMIKYICLANNEQIRAFVDSVACLFGTVHSMIQSIFADIKCKRGLKNTKCKFIESFGLREFFAKAAY